MKSIVYNYEDIFTEVADDPEIVLMKIPDEILETTEWKPGDTISIKVENNKIFLQKTNG